ncbi:MAG: MBL fold metallo-hydrolase [Thermomicrobiales bacterium]|nr:MBL fold metallo-hydrolase [Thermomicrobiales bacterium]
MADQLSERVYVLPGGTNIGVVLADDGRAVLIDTGLNDTPARKGLRFVREELGTEIAAIINTHGHADHFGGNGFLVKRTSAPVYAPDLDEMTLRHPLMQPIMLYGGADPANPIRTSFLIAEQSPVDGLVHLGENTIAGVTFEAISLNGHSMNQFGYLIDGVFFCADVVFPEVTLEKYPIPYLYGLTEHLAAMETARGVSAVKVVPGHGPILDDINPLVDRNLSAINAVIESLLAIIDRPLLADDVCQRLFQRMNVSIPDAQAYYLLRPTVQAYLAHLERQGAIHLIVEDASVKWNQA